MDIRKSLLVSVLALGTLPLFAQEPEHSKEVFVPHWYMQIQGGAAHTIGETGFSKLISPAAALHFGYRFTPVFGLRFGGSGWQAKGAWVNPKQEYKFKYLQGDVDAVFDLSALFCRFNPRRVFNLYAFVGGAFNHAYDNGAENVATAGSGELEYLWRGSKNSFAGRGGVGADIRLSDRLALNIEGNTNLLTDKFNSKKAGNADWQFNALVGLTIRLGKGSRIVEPVYVAPEPEPEETPRPVVIPERKEPQPRQEVAEKKRETYRCDVFFHINSAVIRPQEQAKIDSLVIYMQKYPESKVALTGYADAGTGNKRINLRLSKERAQSVKDALLKAGIKASRVLSDYKGDSVQPFTENDLNRVTICVAE